MPRMPYLTLGTIGIACAFFPGTSWAQQSSAPIGQSDASSRPNGVPHLAGESANALLIALAPAVQSELKLTEAQKAKVQRLAKSAAQRTRRAADGADPYGPVDVQADPRTQVDQALGRILDRRQRERLHQIVIQAEGPQAITRPEVTDKLNLDPDQIAAIQTLMSQWRQSQAQVVEMSRVNGALAAEPNPDDFARLRLASARMRKRAAEQLNQILNRRQKTILDRILGPAFDLGKLNGEGAAPGSSASPDAPDSAKAEDRDTAKAKADEPAKGKQETPKKRRGRKSTPKNPS